MPVFTIFGTGRRKSAHRKLSYEDYVKHHKKVTDEERITKLTSIDVHGDDTSQLIPKTPSYNLITN